MSKQQVELGTNKTGIAVAPELAAEMVEGTQEFMPSSAGDDRQIALVRGTYSMDAEPVGSVPPPADDTPVKRSAADQAMLTQLMDKLGARLAFERSGVRLYGALISKFDVYGGFENGPERADLEHIRDEELEHYQMLADTIESLGGDPTAVTPAADIQATTSKGIMEVLVDPRTDFIQGLDAILVAELTDNDCWSVLCRLAEQAGYEDLAAECAEAEEHEREHLLQVRTWLANALGIAAPDANV